MCSTPFVPHCPPINSPSLETLDGGPFFGRYYHLSTRITGARMRGREVLLPTNTLILHHVARPRLDHLVWILINKVTPEYFARAEFLQDTHCMGRPKEFLTYQKYFKTAWQKLAKAAIPESSTKLVSLAAIGLVLVVNRSMTDTTFVNTLFKQLHHVAHQDGIL